MQKKCYLFAALMLTGSSAGAVAAEPVARMDEVVVTATKTEEAVRDVPNAVVLKDASDIEESAAASVGELLANEPGIDWRTRGNYGGATEEIKIRGLGSDATQVFLNGVNINSPSLGTADVGQLPLNSIEKIEVVKGSGSLLYGTGATGGTVNIITKGPQQGEKDFRVHGGFGSERSYELSAEQGMYLTGALGYYLTATKKETDGFRDNSDLDHKDVSMKVVYDKGDRLQLHLFSTYIDRDYGVPGPQPPSTTQAYMVNGVKIYNADAASLVNRGSDRNTYNVLELKTSPLKELRFTVRGEYSDMKSYFFQRYNTALATGDESWVTNTVSGLEGMAEWQPFAGASLLVGGQYRDYLYRNEQGLIDTFGVSVPGSLTSAEHGVFTRGAYTEAQYRPNKFVKLLAGIRHENHSRFGYEDLPRFGLVVNPLADTTIKVDHGKHFKAPTMNDLYWPDTGFMVGNPDLHPETGWHTDVTLEQRLLADRLEVSASYFKADIDDKISWAEDPTKPTIIPGWNYWTPSNVNAFQSRGWELGCLIRPTKAMSIGLSYTYTKAEEENSPGIWREALYNAKHLAKGEVNYLFAFGLTATLTVRYVGDRPAYYPLATSTVPRNTLASYVTTDIRLNQRLHEHWLLSLQGNNIFNQGYDTYLGNFTDVATATTTRQGYPGAGRSVFLGLTYEF